MNYRSVASILANNHRIELAGESMRKRRMLEPST